MHRKYIIINLILIMLLTVSCGSKHSEIPKTSVPPKVTESEPPKLSTTDSINHEVVNPPQEKTTENKENKENFSETKKEADSANLDNSLKRWGFRPNNTHTTPEVSSAVKEMLKKYSGYYVGDTSSKVVYLTFDEGYENGYTGKILDVLRDNDVKAAFFVTRPYIKTEKDLIKRMVNEGHLVCNHTSHHPSMPSKTGNLDEFKKEFTETEDIFREVTGQEMPKYFRPPMGEYSEKSLYLTKELGYKTIFWSFAHVDWIVDKQPTVQQTHDIVMKRVHNGAIILLHAVSKSNTEALDSIIKDLKAEGYRFGTLDELN